MICIDGLVPPTWQSVVDRNYSPWPEPHLIVDSASLSPEAAIAIVAHEMDLRAG